MTAPSYTTDLTDIDDCTGSANWSEATASGWTSINAETYGDSDDFIHGTSALSSSVKTGVGAVLYNVSGTIPTDGAFLVWVKYSAAGGLYTEALGGIRTLLGDAANSFYAWSHLGNDSYLYDGWLNLATNPTVTQDFSVGAYAGSSTITYWGWGYGANSIPSKGNPFWTDILRYGRCEARFQYGETADYCTFAGFATQNDSTNNKWGLIQAMPYGYLWKGLITIGYNSVAADFRDSNVSIFVDNTKKVTSGFNKISIETAASNVEWTGIQITALGTVSKGILIVDPTDDPTVIFDICTFTDMDAFTFQSNSTVDDTVFRRCGLVTNNTAVFTGCLFDEPSGSVGIAVNDLDDLDGCIFNSDGTGHAVDLGVLSASDSMGWNCTDTGYTASSSGNETIKVDIDSPNVLTITIAAGASTPSVYNIGTGGSSQISIVTGSVTTEVTVKDLLAGTNIENAQVLIWPTDGTNFPYEDTVTITGTGTTATVAHTAHGLSTGDNVVISGASPDVYNGAYQITVTGVNAYTYTTNETIGTSPATGTVKATFAFINGKTNSSGYISDTRSISSNQLIAGRVRKAGTSPYYIQGSISGTVDSGNGFSITLQLVRDE